MLRDNVCEGGTIIAPLKLSVKGPPTTGMDIIAVPPLTAEVELVTVIILVLLLPRLALLVDTPEGEDSVPPLYIVYVADKLDNRLSPTPTPPATLII